MKHSNKGPFSPADTENCCLPISFMNVIPYIKPWLKVSWLPQKALKTSTIKKEGLDQFTGKVYEEVQKGVYPLTLSTQYPWILWKRQQKAVRSRSSPHRACPHAIAGQQVYPEGHFAQVSMACGWQTATSLGPITAH